MSDTLRAVPRSLHQEAHVFPTSRRVTSWEPALEEPLRTRVLEVALWVAERMRDPNYVSQIALHMLQRHPETGRWQASSLPGGFAGVALMYGYFAECFPDQGWDTLACQYMNLAAAGTQEMALSSPALLGGVSGMLLLLNYLSTDGKRYQRTIAKLRQSLCTLVLERSWRRSDQHGVAAPDYDSIYGAAGVLSYLVSLEQPNDQELTAIEQLLSYLTWLAEPGQARGREHWYIPPSLLPSEHHRQQSPEGVFDCGLAHGIPGPLAALALTWLANYRYPGLRESIAFLSEWIIEHQIQDSCGITWPAVIPVQASSTPEDWQALPGTRSAWCYGPPGVARSLWLAGQALDKAQLCQIAIEAIEAALQRPISQRFIDAPTICHGMAGLLQICLRFAHECESATLQEHIPFLTYQILDAFHPDYPLGFRNIESAGIQVDQPGWLTGTPGVVMTLLAAATSISPVWDRLLLIA